MMTQKPGKKALRRDARIAAAIAAGRKTFSQLRAEHWENTDGQCLARFQTQDSHEEKLCRNEPSAVARLIENVRAWNGVNITFDDIASYEEVQPPVRFVKQAHSKLTLEQRIADLEAKLAKVCP